MIEEIEPVEEDTDTEELFQTLALQLIKIVRAAARMSEERLVVTVGRVDMVEGMRVLIVDRLDWLR